jgi:hypothetical protein
LAAIAGDFDAYVGPLKLKKYVSVSFVCAASRVGDREARTI